MQVAGNRALVLVEEAHDPDELDASSSARAPRAGRARARAGRRGHRAAARGRARQAALGAVPEDRRGLSRCSAQRPDRIAGSPILAADDRRARPGRAADPYDTSRPEELVAAAGFVKGWLESRDIEVRDHRPQRPARAGRRGRRRAPTRMRRAWCSTAISTSCPGDPEQFEPRIEGDRLIGRGAYDMKGGAGGDDVRAQGPRAPGPRARAARVRARRGVRGARRALDRRDRRARAGRRLRDHRRADRHAHRRRGQGRAGDADRGPRPGRPQLDPVAGRQRGAEGDRRVPRDRVAAVHAASPRRCSTGRRSTWADRGRRRAQQGAGPVHDGRRRPLPARPGPGRDPGPGAGDPGDRGRRGRSSIRR